MSRLSCFKTLSRIFLVAACLGGAATQAQTTAPLALDATSKSVMDLAIELYPSLFPDGTEVRTVSGYLYRFFPTTGIYAGFKDGQVFLLGGAFGNEIVSKGTATSVLTALQAVKAKQQSTNTGFVRGAGLTLTPAFKGLASFANKAPSSNGGGSFVYSQGVGIPSVTVNYTVNANTGAKQVQITITPDFSGVEGFISRGSTNVPACILEAVAGVSAPLCSSVGVTFDKSNGDIAFSNTPMQQGFSGTTTVFTLSGSLTFPPF